MGYFKKLLTCAAIGIALSPYYFYASNKIIGYSNLKERPAIVQTVKQTKPDLEGVVNESEENVIKEDNNTLPYETISPVKKYVVVEDKEWLPFRALGYIGSLPAKTLLMSWKMNNYVTPETRKSIETILENDSGIDGLTVRINHTRPLKDTYRLFTEKQLMERNNFFARLFLGMPTTIIGEFFAKFTRSDYYNPYTRVAVLFSDIEAVAKHEIGHHRDFMRFNKDWVYSLTRLLPPVMLYQEWMASTYSKWTIEENNRGQFGRYLVPAFALYVFVALKTLVGATRWVKRKIEE